MPNTLQLLDRALDVQKQARWAEQLEVSNAAFSLARKRGRLTPTRAGELAQALGEDPRGWIALAVLEGGPDTRNRRRLLQLVRMSMRPACATAMKSCVGAVEKP